MLGFSGLLKQIRAKLFGNNSNCDNFSNDSCDLKKENSKELVIVNYGWSQSEGDYIEKPVSDIMCDFLMKRNSKKSNFIFK